MILGTVFNIIGVVIALVLAEITVSCCVRIAIARFTRGHGVTVPDYGLMLPSLTGCGCAVVLAFLGVHPLLTACTATFLFGAAALPAANRLRIAAKNHQFREGARQVAMQLGSLAWSARYLFKADMLALGRLLRLTNGTAQPVPAGRPPAPGDLVPARAVPRLRDDAIAGQVVPAAVARDLEDAGAMVPQSWADVADDIGDLEPEEEDELLEWMAGLAAGILTVADAFQWLAEYLAAEAGLDPDYVAGMFDLSDEWADMVTVVAALHLRYHEIYEDLHSHRDKGGTFPKKPGWFGDDANTGGAAA